jgi:peptidylprolyl isomerase
MPKRGIRKHRNTILILAGIVIIALFAVFSWNYKPPRTGTTKLRLTTNMGNITILLFDDVPITKANFLNLTRMGLYDGTTFYRVAKNPSVIQGGAAYGNTDGDPRIAKIPDEIVISNQNLRGTVGMAKKGANTAQDQFYINVANNPSLDKSYTIFGKVTEGMDVVDNIANVAVDNMTKPLNNVTIVRAEMLPSTTVLSQFASMIACQRKGDRSAVLGSEFVSFAEQVHEYWHEVHASYATEAAFGA